MNGLAQPNDTTKDWALLVGIDRYPNLYGEGQPGNLAGAVADMHDFARFLTENYLVNPEQIFTVQSPDPAYPDLPVSQTRLNLAKNELINTYNQLRSAGPDWRQRRIYVFLAGHGFIPRDETNRAIILAEAVTWFLPHFIAQDAITFFQTTKMFEEVLLFMDCCAIRNFSINPISENWLPSAPQDSDLLPTKVFKAFAATSDQPTREFPVKATGESRGLFTQLLLKVLRGDRSGKVTTTYVKQVFDQAYDNFACDLADVFNLDGTVTFRPYCPADPGFDIFDFRMGRSVSIRVDLADGVRLSDGDVVEAWQNGTANGTLADRGSVANGELQLDVPDGLITLKINNAVEVIVEVSNRTVVNVWAR